MFNIPYVKPEAPVLGSVYYNEQDRNHYIYLERGWALLDTSLPKAPSSNLFVCMYCGGSTDTPTKACKSCGANRFKKVF